MSEQDKGRMTRKELADEIGALGNRANDHGHQRAAAILMSVAAVVVVGQEEASGLFDASCRASEWVVRAGRAIIAQAKASRN